MTPAGGCWYDGLRLNSLQPETIIRLSGSERERELEKISELKDVTRRLGEAPLGRLLISLSVPGIISMMTMALYNIIDTFWVASLGHEAIAALTVIFPYHILLLAIAAGTGVGVNALISRLFGEGNVEGPNRVAGQVFPITLFFGGIFLVVSTVFTDAILNVFGATPDIIEFGRQYIIVFAFGFPFLFYHKIANDLLRGSGEAVKPMVFMITSAVINIVLDPFLIFGWWVFPEMGVQGAALATTVSLAIGAALNLGYIFSNRSVYRIRLAHLKPDLQILKDIYRVGFPSMVMEITESLCFALFNNVLASFGSLAIAAVGITIRIADFVFMPILGVAHGLLPIVGYNYGARLWKRLWGSVRLAAVSLVVILGFGTAMVEIFAPQLIGIFSDDAELLGVAVPAMRIFMSMLVFIGPSIVFITAFQGLSKGKEVMFLSLARQVVFFVPAILVLPKLIGIEGAWLAMPISDTLGFFVTGFWLLREYRIQRRSGNWKDLPDE